MVDPINYKHQVMAVVVVHQPDWQDVLANIDTYLSAVDTLCVVANSPLTDTQTADLADRQLHLIQNRDNLGVASALNQAAERAESMGYRWLLTMDQDSSFLPLQAQELIASIRLAPPRAAAIGAESLHRPEPVPRFHSVPYLIQSGTLFHLPAWRAIQGFNELLFIDAVDHEFCLRARDAGWQVYVYPSVHLVHRLGRIKKMPQWLFIFHRHPKTGITYHDPYRERFVFRNNFWLTRRYARRFPGWATRRIGYLLLRLLYALILLPEKRSRLRNIAKGIGQSYSFHPRS